MDLAALVSKGKKGKGELHTDMWTGRPYTLSQINPVNRKGVSMRERGALGSQVGGSHYKDMIIQPIEYCQKNGLGYCESTAIKYISRHKKKNGKEDILKAIHVLNLLLELEYSA